MVSVCKPGPALPYSKTLKNVLVIGDSLSIGYTPLVAANLSDIALVQHAPWDVSDGGAEETQYGERCLEFFLASPSGMAISPDLITFNWGMHDGPLGNSTNPGQNLPPTNYAVQLESIVQSLVAFSSKTGAKLLYIKTTAYMCSEASDGCVMNLNNQADAIMVKYGIPTVNPHDAILGWCGPVPNSACFGQNQCFCPHCPGVGYEHLTALLAPVMRAMLG